MIEIPRWTISELIARYTLEPSLRDIFVEGGFDRDILKRCVSAVERGEMSIYEIDSVDVAANLLAAHALTEGNKQRVIVLARELAKSSPVFPIKCLVDRDLDHWLGPLEDTPNLIWTKYCTIESYFFNYDTVRDIVVIMAESKIDNFDAFMASFTGTLKALYAMRLADYEMRLSLAWFDDIKCIVANNNQIKLDSEEYIRRILLKNGKYTLIDDFRRSFTRWLDNLDGDPRQYIRGHDFVRLLGWTINNYRGKKEFASSSALERIFVLIATNFDELKTIFQ